MNVNLWGASPLYVNPVKVLNILTKILAEKQILIPHPQPGRAQDTCPAITYMKTVGVGGLKPPATRICDFAQLN